LIKDRKYSTEQEFFTIHYTVDDAKLLYAVATAKEYPSRVAFALLDGGWVGGYYYHYYYYYYYSCRLQHLFCILAAY